ncbi:2-C-methyl-D-erythritol 4-phosphate cytidylyltransferase [Amycolatopsis sp. NPDC059027]|uniref:IspD/TarI family cytidylyltransferase n=1 Tax=unclassified Amycolatopsis TaxID=2618356 RepID=UPI00366E59C3
MNSVAFVTVAHHAADAELALTPVHGEVLLTHTVRGLLDTPDLGPVVVAAPARFARAFGDAVSGLSPRCRVLPDASVRHAFAAVEPELSADTSILVHDALRAFTPAETFRDVIATVRAGASVVVPVLPMADTVKVTDEAKLITRTEDRTHLRTAQTPLGFTLDAFRAACAEGEPDLTAAIRAGAVTIDGHPDAMRVASPFELTLAEAIAAMADTEETL